MRWDERQRAMLAEMGFRVQPERQAAEPAGAEPMLDAAATRAASPASPAPPDLSAPPNLHAPAPVAPALPRSAPDHAATAPTHFAALSPPALRAAVATCQACGLCEQRRHAVFGGGAQAAQWLVVTDPPDEADDASGEALSGDAGRLLDRMLAAAGLSRTGDTPTAFVTPIVKCRPPRGRTPTPTEFDACAAVLARQVELLQPRLVLAMGVQAARRLVGPGGQAEPLGRLRGRVHVWSGLPLVVTYHPAYLLRSPADKAGAWDDLRLALRTSSP